MLDPLFERIVYIYCQVCDCSASTRLISPVDGVDGDSASDFEHSISDVIADAHPTSCDSLIHIYGPGRIEHRVNELALSLYKVQRVLARLVLD